MKSHQTKGILISFNKIDVGYMARTAITKTACRQEGKCTASSHFQDMTVGLHVGCSSKATGQEPYQTWPCKEPEMAGA
jgi:hypothetical protein